MWLQHHFDLEHTLFLCNGIVTLHDCILEIFLAVINGYADSDHPRKLLMHTRRKPGKSRSWVDTSLSLVPRRDECVRYGMMRLDER